MEGNSFLKVIPIPKLPVAKAKPESDSLFRFSHVILNLTSQALDCLQKLAQKEMEKKSPSVKILEEYYLLHHYLIFIKRLCLEKKI